MEYATALIKITMGSMNLKTKSPGETQGLPG